ncbi:uncharacterized protein [Haliotis asinina]|uniref:uncharacterized protein n=1 Tax=Haliotis asinina TaxID=109174 RepID=UPI0035326F34
MFAMVLHAVCAVLCATVAAANFGPDYTICNLNDFLQQAKQHHGSKRPDLPDQWSVRVEANILDGNYSMDMLEYYDYIGNRASVIYWMENVKTKMIFLYNTNELIIVQYDNEDSLPRCHVNDLAKTSDNTIFGITRYANGTERILPPHQALRFGGDAPAVPHLQTKTEDGIRVDSWKSCSYLPDRDATLLTEQQFSASTGWISASSVVVPVKVTEKGAVHVNSTYTYHLNNEYIFTDFQTTIPVDAFTPPSDVYCLDRVSTLSLSVPNSYSVSSEIVMPQRHFVQWRQFSYDDDLKVMRLYYTPDVTQPSPYGHNQLMYVRDFNTAWTYTVDTVQGNCTIESMTNQYNEIYDQPESNLFLKNAFTYIGQNVSRGIRCNVFEVVLPNLVRPHTVTELYVTARGWEESAGSSFMSDTPVRMEVTNLKNRNKTIYNFYDYNRDQHDIWQTDLSACFDPSQIYDFIIYFKGNHVAEVLADPGTFSQNFVMAIYKHGNMSPMQISNVQIIPTQSSVSGKFTYTYLEESPFMRRNMPFMTVDESQGLLFRDIDANRFVIPLGQNKTLVAFDLIRLS